MERYTLQTEYPFVTSVYPHTSANASGIADPLRRSPTRRIISSTMQRIRFRTGPSAGKFVHRSCILTVIIAVSIVGFFTSCTKKDGSGTATRSHFAEIERVVVRTNDISVRIAGHAASLVFVTLHTPQTGRVTGQTESGGPSVIMTVEGDTLEICRPTPSRSDQEADTLRAASSPVLSLRVPRGTDIEVETQSGNIGIGNIEYAEISLRSSHGSLTVQNTGGVLSASTDSGEITIVEFVGVMHLSTVSGAQRGAEILPSGDCRFESASGIIGVDFADPLDTYKFDLRSETGVIRVGKTRSTGHFTMGSDDITIFGDTISGNQIYTGTSKD